MWDIHRYTVGNPTCKATDECISTLYACAPASHTIQGTPLPVSSGTKKKANLRTESHKSKLWVIKNGSMPQKLENNSQRHKLHLAFKRCFNFSDCRPKRSPPAFTFTGTSTLYGQSQTMWSWSFFWRAFSDGVAKFVQLFQVPKKTLKNNIGTIRHLNSWSCSCNFCIGFTKDLRHCMLVVGGSSGLRTCFAVRVPSANLP